MNQAHHPYKAVIFDFGGVLAVFCDSIGPMRVVKSAMAHGVWEKLETGEIVPDEIDEQLKEALNREAPDLADMLFRNRPLADVMIEDPYFAIALPRIKSAGLQTALLTNNFWLDTGRTRAAQHEKIFGQFDVVIESCKLGIRKPNAKIFEMALSALNVQPSECVFIDDFEENCRAAEELGVKAIQLLLNIPNTTTFHIDRSHSSQSNLTACSLLEHAARPDTHTIFDAPNVIVSVGEMLRVVEMIVYGGQRVAEITLSESEFDVHQFFHQLTLAVNRWEHDEQVRITHNLIPYGQGWKVEINVCPIDRALISITIHPKPTEQDDLF